MKTVRKTFTIAGKLRKQFIRSICSGEWALSQAIPTEKELSDQYQASRTAIREALKSLENQGLLKSTQGSGRWVTPQSKSYRETVGLLAWGSDLCLGQGSHFFSSLSRVSADMGYSFASHCLSAADQKENVRIGMDLNQLDAAIVYTPHYSVNDIQNLANFIPTVSMPHDATSVGVPSFFVDYGFHAAAAVARLAETGHRKIALAHCDKIDRQRVYGIVRRGFDLAKMTNGLELDDSLIWGYSVSEGASLDEYSPLYHRWKNMPDRPTAIISSTSSPLEGMIQAARAEGVFLPDKLSLICLGDLSHDNFAKIKVSHFVWPIEKIVNDSMNCIDQMLNNQSDFKLYNPYYGRFEAADTFRSAKDIQI